MIRRFKKRPEQRQFFRINERIFANTLRLLDSEGKQIGVLSKIEALEKARNLGLDLVEIAPMAKPPVAKIINFKKFLYQQEKKRREEKKKSKISETKEIRLSPFISENDLRVMINRGREFLADGDKVKIVVKFRGRQITHPEFGRKVVNNVIDALSDISKIEREPHFEGNQLVTLITLEKKKQHGKNEDTKVSEQTVQGDEKGQGAL